MSTREHSTNTIGSGPDLITYDVRGDLSSGTPLFIFGSPMEAGGFTALAGQFDDRPVVTFDPRGTGRNPRATSPLTTADHAADLHALVEHLGVQRADFFGGSGGAVVALAYAGAHPERVGHLVAHEPPAFDDLPDGELLDEAIARIGQTYRQRGFGYAMAEFIQLTMQQGPLDTSYFAQSAPEPEQFGMPAQDSGDRTDGLFRNMPGVNQLDLNTAALDTLGDRVTIAVGEDSGQTLAARGARAIAARLGLTAQTFPGDHSGYVGEMFGQMMGKPREFAARLREFL